MPAYDGSRFTPPAPLGLVTLRNASTGVELRVVVGNRQARRAAMFIVPRSNALKLRRSAMLTEHFAPTGLGRGGLAMAINISLLTEFSCVCSNRKFPNSTAVHPGPLPQSPQGEGQVEGERNF